MDIFIRKLNQADQGHLSETGVKDTSPRLLEVFFSYKNNAESRVDQGS